MNENWHKESEAKIVINYLNNGGKAIIGLENLTSQGVDKPNFNSILKEFGINVQSGVVAENNTSYYSTQYGPWFAFADGITGYASGLSSYVFAPYTVYKETNKHLDDLDMNLYYDELVANPNIVKKELKSAVFTAFSSQKLILSLLTTEFVSP